MTGRRDRASRAWLVAVLVSAGLAAPVAPAIAADATVQVGNDKTLSPTTVTVAPGERVTWHWAGPDTDHIIARAAQPESWDSDPGVPDDAQVNHPIGRTFSHTFATQGSFAYVCRVHPDRMQGTVNVAAAPVASFTATPSTALTGEVVSFDASASSASGTTIVRHQWDLDGDGSFETDTGTDARTSRAYASAGSVTVGLRVTDGRGGSANTTRPLNVVAAPAAAAAVRALAPPPVATALPTSPRDSAAPIGRLDPGGTQRAARRRAIVVRGTWNEDSTVRVAATITVPGARPLKLAGPRRSVRAGAKVTLTLRLSGRTLAAVSRALARGRRVGARVTLSATDAAGNGSVATLRVRLAR